ncbi:MFS general substrate transporter [Umbelopsis sp. PMI_123]|nr:MFS general substrate transporter [Umbelopsis sp. PMI_123]
MDADNPKEVTIVPQEKGTAEEAEIQSSTVSIDNSVLESAVTKLYARKVSLLNNELARIGMGWYQWRLFILAGIGWTADNFWATLNAQAVYQVGLEYNVPTTQLPWGSMSLAIGLCLGAVFWSALSDHVGRRFSFNITLLIGGVVALMAAGAPSFPGYCVFVTFIGFGMGGNLPIDGTLFLEFLPGQWQWLLTFLSVWWALGQLVVTLLAWAFITNFSCSSVDDCPASSNLGWRYLYYTTGGIALLMAAARVVTMQLDESPKYLLAIGQDAGVVKMVHTIAKTNGKETTLAEEDFRAIDSEFGDQTTTQLDTPAPTSSNKESLIRKYSVKHVAPLFSSPKLAINTSLIIFIWFLIGLSYPLFNASLPLWLRLHNINTATGIDESFREYIGYAVLGIPGSAIGAYLSTLKFGRKGALALSTILSGVFIFLFAAATSNAQVVAFNCVTSVTTGAMYGVLYAYTPEVFPSPHRGTGSGLAAAANRLGGIIASIIPMSSSAALTTTVPFWVSAALFTSAGLLVLLLPVESRGRMAL